MNPKVGQASRLLKPRNTPTTRNQNELESMTDFIQWGNPFIRFFLSRIWRSPRFELPLSG